MSEAVLYRGSSGKDITTASYSARSTFRHCPREFELTRIQGWSDREQRAAMLFGKCIEAGLQAYEESNRAAHSGVEVFEKLWNDVRSLPEFPRLKYSDYAEKDWDNLLLSGREMMRLYELRAPFLPIYKPSFQQKIRKTIFPGSHLAAINNLAVLDIVSTIEWNHALLSKIEQPSEPRQLIIDVKTSGKDLNTDLVALDPQLAEYAWQTRIPDVAFLWFVKKSRNIKNGDRVTDLATGSQVYVLEVCDEGQIYTGSEFALAEYENSIKGSRGKIREAKKAEFLVRDSVKLLRMTGVTKQRLQFAAARLTEADMDEVGRSVAQTTVEMVRAHEQGFYEKQGGIRFPNEKCNFCSMRWICLNRPDDRDKFLTRRGDEWLEADYEVE